MHRIKSLLQGLSKHIKIYRFFMVVFFVGMTFVLPATHYTNKTTKTIIITNTKNQTTLRLEPDEQGDLYNDQEDPITITSPGISERTLFPTNNSFNYVVTLNKNNAKFEQFDINNAGS